MCMKKIVNRSWIPALFIAGMAAVAACSGSGSGSGQNDTIYLESGVKYLYMNKGEGLAIDSGYNVVSHINLMVGEDTIWNTYNPENKLQFTAKVTSLIDGFDEAVMYARQGDRMMVVIPPELGYGAEGRPPVVPPNATLLFDIDFLEVTAPEADKP